MPVVIQPVIKKTADLITASWKELNRPYRSQCKEASLRSVFAVLYLTFAAYEVGVNENEYVSSSI